MIVVIVGRAVMGHIDQRLEELGLTLPQPAAAVANYLPYVITGNLVVISGQLPMVEGRLAVSGKLGTDLTAEEGRMAARLCAINVLAQLRAAIGDLDRVTRVVRLGGIVNAADNFTDHPAIINTASDLMVDVFEAAGRHARIAFGAASLPLGAAVEIEGLFEVD